MHKNLLANYSLKYTHMHIPTYVYKHMVCRRDWRVCDLGQQQAHGGASVKGTVARLAVILFSLGPAIPGFCLDRA